MTHHGTDIVVAAGEFHLRLFRELLVEYAASLDVTACVHSIDHELESLPGAYGPPDGAMILALQADGAAAGCAALRRVTHGIGELKRLYVRGPFRGTGLGRALTMRIIEIAAQQGYKSLVLDTLPTMTAAMALYESLGFGYVALYRENANEHARAMELRLVDSGR